MELQRGTPEKDIFKILNWAMRCCAKSATPPTVVDTMQKAWHPFVSSLSAGLMKLPSPSSKSLYRGIGGDFSSVVDKYIPGGIVRFSAFTSTSSSPSKAYLLAAAVCDATDKEVFVLKIIAHSARNISPVSMYEAEDEWLLGPEAEFCVLQVKHGVIPAVGPQTVPMVMITEIVRDHGTFVS